MLDSFAVMRICCVCALVVGLAAGCDKGDAAAAGDAGSKKSQAALKAEYQAMSPQQRLEAARSACFVGTGCSGFEAEALLGAAGNDVEKKALREAARAALLGQLQTRLAAKAKKPVSVKATGNGDAVISVRGVCNRFLIEDFVGGPEKRQARFLDYARIECSDASLTAAADLHD